MLFHLKFLKSLRLLRSETSWGLDFKFRKNVRNWLKSESVWNSFYLCFYITLCLWCQFLFRNNNGRELNFTFFASFYESIRKKLSNFLSLQMMYVSRKTESFTFCLKYSLQFSKLILKYFFHYKNEAHFTKKSNILQLQ